jgi:MtN3 and saliva related transmembrane protein
LTNLEIFGLTATCLTTSSFVPQVWHTWKSRDASGVSLPTFLILTIGLGMWLIYGYLIGDLPLMVGNAIMVVLTAAIVIMKLVFPKR